MASEHKNSKSGIASIFNKKEIKDYFNAFIAITAGLEFIIFVVHFIGTLGPDKPPFPWKQYAFVSFITPLSLVIILGIIIVGFNYFIYGNDRSSHAVEGDDGDGSDNKLERQIQTFFSALGKIPVLPSLFILGVGSFFLFKLDVILSYVGVVGEKTANYIFYLFIVVVACLLLFILCWMYYKFKLDKEQLWRQSEYRNRVLDKAGLIILDDNTVLNKDGQVIALEQTRDTGKEKADDANIIDCEIVHELPDESQASSDTGS